MSLEAAIQNLADAVAALAAGNASLQAAVGKPAGATAPKPPATPVVASPASAPAATTAAPAKPKAPPAPKAPAAPPAASASPANGNTSPLRKQAKDLVQKVAASKGRDTAIELVNAVQDGTPGTVSALAEENLQAFVDAATEVLAS